MEDFERIEYLLKEKRLEKLTTEEKEFLEAYLDQDPNDYGAVMAKLVGEKKPIDAAVKRGLMRDFRHPHARRQRFLTGRVPAYSNALVAVVAFAMGWWLFHQPQEVQTVEKLVQVVQRDTIEVARLDTVFVEKYIEVPTTIMVAQEAPVPEVEVTVDHPQNKALSEKQELLDLVVRSDSD